MRRSPKIMKGQKSQKVKFLHLQAFCTQWTSYFTRFLSVTAVIHVSCTVAHPFIYFNNVNCQTQCHITDIMTWIWYQSKVPIPITCSHIVNISSYTTCHPALDCWVSDRLASPMSETSCYADLVSASRKPRRCVRRMLVTPVLPEGRELVHQLTRNVAVSMGLPGPQTSLLPVPRCILTVASVVYQCPAE